MPDAAERTHLSSRGRRGHAVHSTSSTIHRPEFSLDKGVHIAEITIPGLDSPLAAVRPRPDNETLTVDALLRHHRDGMGARDGQAGDHALPTRFYALVKIDPDSSRAAVCDVPLGPRFPGGCCRTGWEPAAQQLPCLVEQVVQKYTLFSPEGVPLRATAVLTLREYKPLDAAARSART